MKVSDYIIDFLVKRGVGDIFLVTGGGIMHLVDSVGRHEGIDFVCNYHEQASAIAAEAYARTRQGVGVCLVTTGPGSTNALSGIAGAFVDSIPVVVISGQVRQDLIADYSKLRQLGPQEINIDDMARPVTKYFVTIRDPKTIRRELECAWWHATNARPGPVWINLPLDVQGAEVDPARLSGFELPSIPVSSRDAELKATVAEAVRLLGAAQRPVIIGGNGIHLAKAQAVFDDFVRKVGAPVLSTIGGVDLLFETHPLYMGRFGPAGQRRANFTLQNADLILSIGASMSVGSIGFNTAGFAPKARRIMVTIDPSDLEKSNYRPDLPIAADAKDFLQEFLTQTEGTRFQFSSRWVEACSRWKERYPTLTDDHFHDKENVNSYVFARTLSEHASPEAVIITGISLDGVSVFHSFSLKEGQRLFTNINYGAMGWDLPAAVGACIGHQRKPTYLVTGDGSIQFNIQELMAVRSNNLPIGIFVFNNDGYESIRATQTNFFQGAYVGSDFRSGIGNPSFRHLAAAYDLGYEYMQTNEEVSSKLPGLLASERAFLCELKISPTQTRSPKTMSVRKEDGTFETRPLEDMFPFLSREELWENMHMFDEEEAIR